MKMFLIHFWIFLIFVFTQSVRNFDYFFCLFSHELPLFIFSFIFSFGVL